jgi:23S rRNA (cytosine1962-C5)-methyltransferase
VQPALFNHPDFPDHALLDSGDGEKLERFGEVTLRRPDPQALWERRLDEETWAGAHLSFVRESDRGGRWQPSGKAPRVARGREAEWGVQWGAARLLVRPTPFKHVGVFPEQAANWAWLTELKERFNTESPRLLNLFGYSGAASVIAALAGYEVTHVDASRTSLSWAAENAAASGLGEKPWRVLLEDAPTFVKREARRGSKYDLILLDPPHYGRGPAGEKWDLGAGLAPLLKGVREILSEQSAVCLSTYAVGISPLSLVGALEILGEGEVEAGELALPEQESGIAKPRLLPAGFCARFMRGLV